MKTATLFLVASVLVFIASAGSDENDALIVISAVVFVTSLLYLIMAYSEKKKTCPKVPTAPKPRTGSGTGKREPEARRRAQRILSFQF